MNTRTTVNLTPLKKNSIQIQIYGHTCNVISIDDLIAVKKKLNRPKDLHAVEELLKIKELNKHS